MLPLALEAQAQSGNHYTAAMLDVYRGRALLSPQLGPFNRAGDAFYGSPGDWQRIVSYATQFYANPTKTTTDNADDAIVWGGLTATDFMTNIDGSIAKGAPDRHPNWHGVKLESAAFYALVSFRNGDTLTATNNALLVKNAILHQIAQPGATPARWLSLRPDLQANGFYEASWLLRFLYAYDYTKHFKKLDGSNLYSSTEVGLVTAWFRGWGSALHKGPDNQIEGYFNPRSSYTAKNGNISDARMSAATNLVFRLKSEAPYNSWASGNVAMAYVDANGVQRDSITRLSQVYSNRWADRFNLVGQVGLVFGTSANDSLIGFAVRYAQEWLRFGVYPDGAFGELQRCGDYDGNPSQGLFYAFANLQQFIMLADGLERRFNDPSLYNYSTRQGFRPTKSPNRDKNLALVLNRIDTLVRNNLPVANRWYWKAVANNNRICLENGNSPTNTSRYTVHDGIFAVANLHYQNANYERLYTRHQPEYPPYPAPAQTGTSLGLSFPYGGSTAILPGILLQFGMLPDANTTSTPPNNAACPLTIANTFAFNHPLNLDTVTTRYTLAVSDVPYQIQLRTRLQAMPSLNLLGDTAKIVTITPTNGDLTFKGKYITGREYEFAYREVCNLYAGNFSRWSILNSFAVCPRMEANSIDAQVEWKTPTKGIIRWKPAGFIYRNGTGGQAWQIGISTRSLISTKGVPVDTLLDRVNYNSALNRNQWEVFTKDSIKQNKPFSISVRKICVNALRGDQLSITGTAPVCPIPQNIIASNTSASRVTMSWDSTRYNQMGYRIKAWRKATGASSWTAFALAADSIKAVGQRYHRFVVLPKDSFRFEVRSRCDSVSYSGTNSTRILISDSAQANDPKPTLEFVALLGLGENVCQGTYPISAVVRNTSNIAVPAGRTIAFSTLYDNDMTTSDPPIEVAAAPSLTGSLDAGQMDTLAIGSITILNQRNEAILVSSSLSYFDEEPNSTSDNGTSLLVTSQLDRPFFYSFEELDYVITSTSGTPAWSILNNTPILGFATKEGEKTATYISAAGRSEMDSAYLYTPCHAENPGFISFYQTQTNYEAPSLAGTYVAISRNGGVTYEDVQLVDLTTGQMQDYAPAYALEAGAPRWRKFGFRTDNYTKGAVSKIRFKGKGTKYTEFAIDLVEGVDSLKYDMVLASMASPVLPLACASTGQGIKLRVYNNGDVQRGPFTIHRQINRGGSITNTTYVSNMQLAKGQSIELPAGDVPVFSSGGCKIKFWITDMYSSNEEYRSSDTLRTDSIFYSDFNKVCAVQILNTDTLLMKGTQVNLNGAMNCTTRRIYSSAGIGSIIDGGETVNIIDVPQGQNASHLKRVLLNVKHTGGNDLNIWLRAPNGSSTELFGKPYANGVNLTHTIFTDSSGYPNINSPLIFAPYTGTYQPKEQLSNLDGTAEGQWQLIVNDQADNGAGYIESWALDFGDTVSAKREWYSSNYNLTPFHTGTPPVGQHPGTMRIITGGLYNFKVEATQTNGCQTKDSIAIQIYDGEWTGTISQDWHTAGNWLSYVVPSSGSSVYIPSTANRAPAILGVNADVQVKDLLLGKNIELDKTRKISVNGNLVVEPGLTARIVSWSHTYDALVGTLRLNGGDQIISGNLEIDSLSKLVFACSTAAIKGNISMGAGAKILFDTPAKLTIALGKEITQQSDTNYTAAISTLPAGASITGQVRLNQTVRRSKTNRNGGNTPPVDWHMVAAPFVEATYNQWSNSTVRFLPENNCTTLRYTEDDVTPGIYNGRLVENDGWKVQRSVETDRINENGKPKALRHRITNGYNLNPQFFNTTTHTGVLSSWGTPFQHTQTSPITFTPGTFEGGGWNLMANPYPAPLDWDSVYRANSTGDSTQDLLGPKIAIWNPAERRYGEYNSITKKRFFGLKNVIPAGQSFFVKTFGDSTFDFQQIIFKEKNKWNKNVRDSSRSFIRYEHAQYTNELGFVLSDTGDIYSDDIGANLEYRRSGDPNFNASEGDDSGLDGEADIQTFSADGQKCRFQVTSNIEFQNGGGLRLRVLGPPMRYYIKVSGMDNFEPNCRFFLREVNFGQPDSLQDLEENPRYEFDLTGPRRPIGNRFYLCSVGNLVAIKDSTKPSPKGRTLSDMDMVAFPNPVPSDGTPKLSLWLKGGAGKSMLRLIDARGAEVAAMQAADALPGGKRSVAWALPSKLSAGIYLLQWQTDAGRKTIRLVVE